MLTRLRPGRRDRGTGITPRVPSPAAGLGLGVPLMLAIGDVIGVIVFIFVLLLITDILGFTKIFPFTRSIR